MLTIAVCDDDVEELARISGLLARYRAERGEALAFDAYPSALTLLDALRRKSYGLLLLDILMPGLSGIQAAREVRAFDDETRIIFLTSSPEYAVESYTLGAYYYLLKPAAADTLYPILDRLLLSLRRQEEALVLSLPAGILRLPFSRIELLEVFGKRLVFHLTDGGVRELAGTLSAFEGALLARREFVKVHRSVIVNLEHVRTLGPRELTTCAGASAPISRLLYPQVRESYMEYLFVEKGVE